MLSDALAFINQVQTQFIQQPNLYRQFLDIMRNSKEKIFETPETMNWLSTLFFCHPKLIQDFNIFLPPGYKMECGTVENHFALRLIMHFTAFVRIAELEVMPSLTLKEKTRRIGQPKWINPASLSILRPCSGIFEPRDWTIEQPASSALGVTKASRTFLDRLKAFLARLKAAQQVATGEAWSDERYGTPHVRLGYQGPRQRSKKVY